MINKKNLQALRRTIFSAHYPIDDHLIDLTGDVESHYFLRCPASHITFLYITQFIASSAPELLNKPLSEIKILDWGAGKGHINYLLRKLGCHVISCDIHQKERGDSTFGIDTPIIDKTKIEVVPLENPVTLPFSDEQFDIVLSVGVLEHVDNDQASLQEISRILHRSGFFYCFNLPYYFSWTQRLHHLLGNYYHDRLYGKNKIYKLLSAADFKIIDLWHRQLFPKNHLKLPCYRLLEKIDQALTNHTLLKYLATSLEFIAIKK